MCRRWNRWVIVFAVLSINFAGIKISAFAANCLSAVNIPGCAYGLPAEQYQQLLAVMAANPAPNGHPLPVDAEGVKKYTATTGQSPHWPSSFTGLLFDSPPPLPMGWLLRNTRPITLPGGEADLTNDRMARYTPVYIYATLNVGGWEWDLIGPKKWVMGQVVAHVKAAPQPGGGRWVAVDTVQQVLTAYENDRLVFATLISSGVGKRYTQAGVFQVYLRQEIGDMSALMGTPDAYNIYYVPYIMYFNSGMALHGATWHDNFGYPMSHGCVNMTITDAHWLFDWSRGVPNMLVNVWRSK
jgi:hypothetical protein